MSKNMLFVLSAVLATIIVHSSAAPMPIEVGDDHPSLPTMWTAYVSEFGVGKVYESESFVYKPTAQNPSGKWTNFTDGSCNRLIYSDGLLADNTRYLLGCGQTFEDGSAACCVEENSTPPIEYQIPNVHPAILSPVKNAGKKNITLFDGSTVETDVWTWDFLIEKVTAYTTPAPGNPKLALLHKWVPEVTAEFFPNEYVNYKAVPAADAANFIATFQVPSVCAKAPACQDQHKKGKISDASLGFLRAGRTGPPRLV